MIKYFPDRVQKKYPHMAERWANPQKINRDAYGANTVPPYNYYFSPLTNCEVKNISVQFSVTSNKTYAINKITGRGIVKGLNDMLYLKSNFSSPREITLDAGFYRTGALLAAQIKTKLDADTVFVAEGLAPFTVVFDVSLGRLIITPAGGNTIQYLNYNARTSVRQYSTAGYPLGLNNNTAQITPLIGDVMGDMGLETAIASAGNSASTSVLVTDTITLNEDEAIQISVSAGMAMWVKHDIDYINLA